MSLGKLVTKKSLFTSVLTGSVYQNRNPHQIDTPSILFFPARIKPAQTWYLINVHCSNTDLFSAAFLLR